jgi:flagellin-like hook-associated protein FlgL
LYTNLGTSSGVGTSISMVADGGGGDQGYIGINKGSGNGFVFGEQNRDFIWQTGNTTPFNGTERMRLNSSGNLGIGQASPSYRLDVVNATGAGATTSIRLNNPGTAVGDGPQILFTSGSSTTGGCAIAGYGTALNAAAMRFFSGGNTEAMRLDSSQNLLVGATATSTTITQFKTYVEGPSSPANTNSTAIADQRCGLYVFDPSGGYTNNEGANSALLLHVDIGGSSRAGNLMRGYFRNSGGSTFTYQVEANGTVTNSTGSYGTISDEKVKQDIVDSGSQWQDIKNVRVRKYRLKSEVARNENAYPLIGVVAQELEQTSPNLVDTPEGYGTDDGLIKSVKTSVLQMKALKALQEAMARIETLETTITAQQSTIQSLTERLTALENK